MGNNTGANYSYVYSEYARDIKVIFVDPDNNASEMILHPHEARAITHYRDGMVTLFVYLPDRSGQFPDTLDETQGYVNYHEKRVGRQSRSFIVDNQGRIHLQRYMAPLNVRE
ncbi:hypothetical protein Poli38472_010260 [Pythium oligandrum]|uniref:Uncharacterized protein n=1 Tax=Pythium oligandrum TaxID=41045 RepID=A0A8K1C8M5_PYTOL|nr:hypothetical protein Poli38472_010260 [Pythium oligandrum]|eukprot:TMW58701.1 hypothetical protein Poli38472_010260 [Pythium oligandrum]